MTNKIFTFSEIKKGLKYGIFTVIGEPYEVRTDYAIYMHAECMCECGKISIKSNHQLSRLKKSEFCSKVCLKRANDPTVPEHRKLAKKGDFFGEIEVLDEPFYKMSKKYREQFVLILCHGCKITKVMNLQKIKHRNYKSCGCKKHENSNNARRKCSLAENGMKICAKCQIKKSIEEFGPNLASKDSLKARCKRCVRNATLKTVHGITYDDYEKMYENQDGKCSICKKVFDKLNVDHCHISNNIRELLCQNCNRMIGQCYEDIKILESAIEYLNKYEYLKEDGSEYKTRRDLIIDNGAPSAPGVHWKAIRWKERKLLERESKS